MFEVRGTGEQATKFLAGENVRKQGRLPGGRDREIERLPVKDLNIEEAEGRDDDIASAETEMTINDEVKDVILKLMRGDEVRREVVEFSEGGDSSEIRLLSFRREAAKVHSLDHFVAKGRHRGSLK